MLRDYLEFMTRSLTDMNSNEKYKYRCFEHYVLTHGKTYPSDPIPKERKAEILAAIKKHRIKFPIKQCFGNCLEFVLKTKLPGVTYVEGYATAIIPIHHAWLSVDGYVFDPTLRLAHPPERKRDSVAHNRIWGDLQGREYIGVEFPDWGLHHRRAVETELLQSVIDDWQNDWPALRGEYDG